MGFLDRLKAAGAAFRDVEAGPQDKAFDGRFDATRSSHLRENLWYLPDFDVVSDVSEFELSELWKKSEFLYDNQGIYRRLIRGSTRYSVGRGIVPMASTEDPDWNRQAEDLFDAWARNASAFDVSGRFNFYQSQRALLSGTMRTGDAFVSFTTSFDRNSPMLQFFEGVQINSGSVPKRDEAQRWINGVRINAVGRPIKYRLQKKNGSERAMLDAERTAHIWDPERMRGVRGRPWGTHALVKLQDWREIAAAATAGVKLDQMLGLVRKRKDDGIGPPRLQGTVQVANNGDIHGAPVESLENIFSPGAIASLQPGEELESFKSEKPHERMTKWLDYLVRDAAHGFGISPELAWNLAGVGGAPMRWILEDGQRFFEENQQMLIDRYCRRAWAYRIAWAMRDGQLGQPKGDRPWWKVNWIPPQKATVDRTKDGKMEIDLIKSGLGSIPRYFRGLGEDWQPIVREQIDALVWIKEEAESKGLSLADVVAPASNAPPDAFGAMGPEDDDGDDD